MCQGLPCIGARVRILRDISRGFDEVRQGSVGEVVEEHLSAREISVEVTTRTGNVTVIRIDERSVEVIARPEGSAPESSAK